MEFLVLVQTGTDMYDGTCLWHVVGCHAGVVDRHRELYVVCCVPVERWEGDVVSCMCNDVACKPRYTTAVATPSPYMARAPAPSLRAALHTVQCAATPRVS